MSNTQISPQKLQKFAAGCLFGILISLIIMAHARTPLPIIDDAFITYRYALNLSEGQGFVYNHGERVLGTTTPGYALLLSGLQFLLPFLPLPSISLGLNAVLLITAGWMAWQIAYRMTENHLISVLISGLVCFSPWTLYASLGGMESSLFLAGLLTVVWALLEEKPWTAAVGAGLMPLIRPEGLLITSVIILIFTTSLFRGQIKLKKFLKLAGLLALPFILWIGISWFYYGSPIPHSIVAKRAGLYPVSLQFSIQAVVEKTARSFLLNLPGQSVFSSVILLGTLLIFGWGTYQFLKTDSRLMGFPVLVVVLMIFFAISKTLIFPHYLALFEGGLKVILFVGGAGLIKIFLEKFRQGDWMQPAVMFLGSLMLLPSLVLYPWQGGKQITENQFYPLSILRIIEYRNYAQNLEPLVDHETTVILPEIGALGYYLPEAKIIDAGGLVSPEAVPYLPVPSSLRPSPEVGVIPPDLVQDYQPDLVIFIDIFGTEGILDQAWFFDQYELVVEDSKEWIPWGTESFFIYARKGLNFPEIYQQVSQ
jgi:hypothetical protein